MSNIFITRVLHFKFQTNFVQIYKDNPWKQSTFGGGQTYLKKPTYNFVINQFLKG